MRIKVSQAIVLVVILILEEAQGKKCPGRCLSSVAQCKTRGGKVAGYCTNGLPCCDYSYQKTGSCGAKIVDLTTAIFKSPDYPDFGQGDLTCQFEFAFRPKATGIVIEFTDVQLDGKGFIKNSACEADQIFLRGFRNWMPPALCGNLTNYAAVIDLGSPQTKGMTSLTVLTIVSSQKYKWNMKISQLFKGFTPISTNDVDHEKEGSDDKNGADQDIEKIEEESPEEQLVRVAELLKIDPSSLETTSASEDDGFEGMDPPPTDFLEEPFIVNGEETNISEVPWQASIRSILKPSIIPLMAKLKLKNCTLEEGLHFCGGSVISNQHVLSAAHCFLTGTKSQTWKSLPTVKVVLGDSNVCDNVEKHVQEFQIDKVYFHYAYDQMTLLNDVVVVKLKRKIKFSPRVASISMAEPEDVFQDHDCKVSGWGSTNLTSVENDAVRPEQLQVATMYIGNASECKEEQRHMFPSVTPKHIVSHPKYSHIFNSLLCTYVDNATIPKLVGPGDSGGPLVVSLNENSTGDYVLAGVCSYMLKMQKPKGNPHDVSLFVDFYQSVAYYRKWIELAMQ